METTIANSPLQVRRVVGQAVSVFDIKGIQFGLAPLLIAGPCSIESYEQLDTIARSLSSAGVRVLRGGAFKPRTSPYSFQGLGVEGLKMLQEIGKTYGMVTVSEITSEKDLDSAEYIDIIQIGSRNMQNFSLLKAVGRSGRPVLLKRGFMCTLEEFLLAAEYIYSTGNAEIILCERGIRTFETSTRFTLDIGAIALLKKETHLPVIVDISHSLGRKDIIQPVAKAVLASGIDGIMVEVHNDPAHALSDAKQQLTLEEFNELRNSLNFEPAKIFCSEQKKDFRGK